MSLKEYARKRDFHKTPEPGATPTKQKVGHRFVIQKHDASRMHYDFRLEIGGTLKSWAVPKGVPFAHGEKHLAVHVEDHPLAYIDFEGTIPEGQYGGGTVMVWDQGTFEPLSKTPAKDLAKGKLHFTLHGTKLKGEWYLVRLRDEKQWLLIRGGDDMKPVSRKQEDTSALSGRSMRELAKGDRVWQSKATSKASSKSTKARSLKPAALPKFVEPMKARLASHPPRGDWSYEIKFDGFRALALKGGSQVRLLSRNEKDFGSKFPEVMEAVLSLDARDAIIDGEIVALDEEGRSSFQLLQARELGQERSPLFFYAFDLLQLNGESLVELPLLERREKLAHLLRDAPEVIRYSDSLGTDAKRLLTHAKKLGLEGLIGKRTDSRYEIGKRTGSWIKLKLRQEQEFVIGGYTDPEGTRPYFGALLVGVHRNGKLTYSGKVGTGFDHKLLRSLHGALKKIARDSCPFTDLPEKSGGRWRQGITRAEMKRCHWVEAKMVCQVKFGEWTRDDRFANRCFSACARTRTRARWSAKRRPDHGYQSDARSRGPQGRREQSRQGLLSEDRIHEGAGDRLLHPCFGGAAAALEGSPDQPQALPGRRGRILLLRETVPEPSAQVGEDGEGGEDRRRSDRLLRNERPALAGVGGESRGPRDPHVPASRAIDQSADSAGFRPRSGSAGGHRAVLPGRPVAEGGFRFARPAVVSEDVGVEGVASLRAAEHARDLRADEALCPCRGVAARKTAPGARRLAHAKGAAQGQGARRLEPERRQEDHDQRLLPASEGAAHGIDAGDVG
jgi:bifunctional non-homologous end joining protein LigD